MNTVAEGSGLTIFNLWGIAWRTTVTVVVFGIVAYLSMGYGFTKRDQLAIAQIQQAYQAGAMDALLQCPKVQRQRTDFWQTNEYWLFQTPTPPSSIQTR